MRERGDEVVRSLPIRPLARIAERHQETADLARPSSDAGSQNVKFISWDNPDGHSLLGSSLSTDRVRAWTQQRNLPFRSSPHL